MYRSHGVPLPVRAVGAVENSCRIDGSWAKRWPSDVAAVHDPSVKHTVLLGLLALPEYFLQCLDPRGGGF